MEEKIVAFAGHRYEWNCIGIEEKLLQTIEKLINKGYTTFYDGACGAFDKKCLHALIELKRKYPQIKIIKILSYYLTMMTFIGHHHLFKLISFDKLYNQAPYIVYDNIFSKYYMKT